MGTREVKFCDCCGEEGGAPHKRWLARFSRAGAPESLATREAVIEDSANGQLDLCSRCLRLIDDAVCIAVDKIRKRGER